MLFVSLFVVNLVNSQDFTSQLINNLKSLNIADANNMLQSTPTKPFERHIEHIFKIQLQLLTSGNSEDLKINYDEILDEGQKKSIDALALMTEADILKHKLIGQDSVIFKKYQKALSLSKTSKPISCEIIKRILIIVSQNARLIDTYPKYLEVYKKNIYDEFESINYELLKLNYEFNQSDLSYIKDFKNNLNKIPNSNFYDILKVTHYRLIGMNYDLVHKDYDSAYHYHNKSMRILENYEDIFYVRNESFSSLVNIGIVLNQQKKYSKSNAVLKKAIQIKLRKDKEYNKVLAFDWIADNFKHLNILDSTLFYLEKKIAKNDSLDHIQNANNINYFSTKFETEKKEKENLKLKAQNLEIEAKRKQNKNLLLASVSLLIFGSILFYLIQKNTKRKQLIAEQEKAIEVQKLTSVLKEQELASIDAMIEGQEKERQRIANDLHDDLGGLMANVKLHFNTLMDNKSTEMFKKTNSLLDEAYQKIRSIAHAKNSGVIAKQGLLKAIQQMAKKISTANNINLEVVDHGLESRLNNSLELTIFRIVQELVTNIIKHAQAKEATIHLTQHENSLNIMVEDDGKGFKPKQITKAKGMGLSSIDKRVDYLNGNLEIESDINQGTTIIIDIPI